MASKNPKYKPRPPLPPEPPRDPLADEPYLRPVDAPPVNTEKRPKDMSDPANRRDLTKPEKMERAIPFHLPPSGIVSFGEQLETKRRSDAERIAAENAPLPPTVYSGSQSRHAPFRPYEADPPFYEE